MSFSKTSGRSPVRLAAALAIVFSLCAGHPHASFAGAPQPPVAGPRPSEPVARSLSEGWAALAAGDLSAAERAVALALRESNGSLGAVTLAIEVDIAAARQPVAGLDTYERWLGARVVESPYLLRRIAQAHLRGIVGQAQHPRRLEAARLLAADGDGRLVEDLAASGGGHDLHLLAAAGNERGVKALIAQLEAPVGGKVAVIDALARTGNPLAVPSLVTLLEDPLMENRAAAADALGRLGATGAVARIEPLLQEQAFPVRMSAATALYRLGNMSGAQFLDDLLTSDHATVRLSAAEALSVRPGGAWLGVARSLAMELDETVRLGAARLLARHDPPLAAAALHSLARSENPAIREEAERAFVGQLSADFAGLRRALRSPDSLTAVRAAGRILELTR